MTQDDVGKEIREASTKIRIMTNDDVCKIAGRDVYGRLYMKPGAAAEPTAGERIKAAGERSSDVQDSWEQQFAQVEDGWERCPEASSHPANGGDSTALDARRPGAHALVCKRGVYLSASSGEAVPASGGDSIVERSSAKSPNAAPKKTVYPM